MVTHAKRHARNRIIHDAVTFDESLIDAAVASYRAALALVSVSKNLSTPDNPIPRERLLAEGALWLMEANLVRLIALGAGGPNAIGNPAIVRDRLAYVAVPCGRHDPFAVRVDFSTGRPAMHRLLVEKTN